MKNIFLFLSAALIIGTTLQYTTQNNVAFAGVSDEAHMPANIEPIEMAEIERVINSQPEVVLFLYASWCPYCHRQLGGLDEFSKMMEMKPILAISTDSDPAKFAKFLAAGAPIPNNSKRLYRGGDELRKFIIDQGGTFGGGIPYFAVFENGKLVNEHVGLTHPERFKK